MYGICKIGSVDIKETKKKLLKYMIGSLLNIRGTLFNFTRTRFCVR